MCGVSCNELETESLDDRPVTIQVTMQVAMQVRALEAGLIERDIPYKTNSWTQKVSRLNTQRRYLSYQSVNNLTS